jgi:acetyltransferase-like isoleucine patch superfamily enzyme
MKKRIIYYLQKLFGLILNEPLIPETKTTGYSLVKSQRADFSCSSKARYYAPFYFHKVSLGDYSYISRNADITNTEIGKFCSIGPNFCCGLGIHPTHGISTSPMFYSTARQNGSTLIKKNKIEESKRTFIGNDVFIGANVTLLDGLQIGDGAVIGAGAVVTKNIPPYAIAVGIPAKVIKYRFDKEQIAKVHNIEWWNFEDEKLPEIEKYFFDIDSFIEKHKME